MERINPDLLSRLGSKLNVSTKQVYARIAEVSSRTMLPRHVAALVLAAESGIGFQRYASTDDLNMIRASQHGAGGTSHNPAPIAIANGAPGRRQRSKTNKTVSRTKDNSVFVVHGRDEGLRKSMFEFLRALSLNPMEWSKAVLLTKKGGANPYVGDILDKAMAKVQAVVVIFSPDDVASLKPSLQYKGEAKTEGRPQGQPRPNVIFEAGLAFGRHPEKTLLVQVGTVREFSDIAGKHVVRLNNDSSKRLDVANRIAKIGCKIDLSGPDWTNAGDFRPKADLPKKRAGRKN